MTLFELASAYSAAEQPEKGLTPGSRVSRSNRAGGRFFAGEGS